MSLLHRIFGRRAPEQPVDAISAAHDVSPELRSLLSSALGGALLNDLLKERVSERRWRNMRRILISLATVVLFGIYVGFYVTSLGYRIVPNTDIVGVVRLTGPIAEGSQTGSADAVIEALSKAFRKPNVKAIVLAIDSPGGKPAESERIGDYIQAKKKETGKPVIAVIGNTGASAAYMVAVHADEIYAGKYSLVGSIGAVLTTWDLHKLPARFDVERKVYASGALKNMLDQWSPITPEADAKASQLVGGMGRTFARDVQALRGSKLKAGVDLWTGEVWDGQQANELGLTDGVATLDSVIKDKWGVGYYDFGPRKGGGGLGFPFTSVFDALIDSLAEAVSTRLFASVP